MPSFPAACETRLRSPEQGLDVGGSLLHSCLCTETTLLSAEFQDWAETLGEARGHLHRKVWEWCFITQALAERGMLQPGRRGLGFAVGQEPLTAAFVSKGASILATDLYTQEALARGWIETDQHADGFSALNKRGICGRQEFQERVQFKFADMNNIGAELHDNFDFLWSSCAFEHLGSLDHGERFVLNAMACLKPGGVAVHTTEYNASSNFLTVRKGETVLYRKKDIQGLARRLRAAGHQIDIDFDPGKGAADGFIDVPPYTHATHLKLRIRMFTATSIGLIIQKGE